MTENKRKILIIAFLSLLCGLGISALVIAIGPGGWDLQTLILSGLVVAIGFFLLTLTFRWAEGGKTLAWIMAIGLVLRLAVSIGLTLGLPVYGYESEEHQAGYIFADSYDRDNAAWSLASSEEPVISAFKNEYLADQYGGLLSLMALQYRYLSPDAHRQMLPLLVSGIVFMLAVPFLWKALRSRWNRRVAFVAALVFTFYPEAVLLSSAHMREPYLLCLASIATWAVISWEMKPNRSVIILAACFFGLALISWRSGVVVAGVLLAWLFLDIVMEKWQPNRRIWGWLLVVAGFLFVARLSYPWIRETAVYDTYLTVQSSGILQVVLKAIGRKYQLQIVGAYGLTQPLFPAAVVALSNAFASTITILRSLGWYLLAPILVFGFFASWKAKPARDRRVLIWLTTISLIWILVSSFRAGGDMWDNPRYRTIFLPWLALIAGWVWDWVFSRKNPWLWRLYLIEFLFIMVFMNFYLVRYAHIGVKISIYTNFGLMIGLTLLVLGAGLLHDLLKNHKPG
jgi:hypothetical protein